MSAAAVRYVGTASSKKPKTVAGSLHLKCHVTPGVSNAREGIKAVTESEIELSVAAPPVDGQANKAVRLLLSQVLGVPRSTVDIIKGDTSRDKVFLVSEIDAGKDPEVYVESIKQKLEAAVDK